MSWLCRVRMAVQQSGIRSVQMQDAASDAAEQRQRRRAVVANGSKTAAEAFRNLLEKVGLFFILSCVPTLSKLCHCYALVCSASLFQHALADCLPISTNRK